MNTMTLNNMICEAKRILELAEQQNIPLRLIGGVAIHLRCTSSSQHPAFIREYKDLDFVSIAKDSNRVIQLLENAGYTANKRFNSLQGSHRLLFYDEQTGKQIDIFLDRFEMCHKIDLSKRLLIDPISIPLSELFLTKVQIISLNEKDAIDTFMLLHTHPIGLEDGDIINVKNIASICAKDWGWHHTISLNLKRLLELLPLTTLTDFEKENIVKKIMEIRIYMDAEPKSIKWKLRDKIGDRITWYDEPEEAVRQ
jgi:hypothetical protein